MDCLTAVLLGPTAINRLPVVFDFTDEIVSASIPNHRHPIQNFDLGSGKLHFQIDTNLTGYWIWSQGGKHIKK